MDKLHALVRYTPYIPVCLRCININVANAIFFNDHNNYHFQLTYFRMLAVSTNSLMYMLMYCTLMMTEIIAAKGNESQQHSKNLIESPFQPNEWLSNSQYIFSHDVQWSCFGSHSNSIVLKNCCRIERIFCSKSGPSLSFSKCATFDGHSLSIASCRHYFEPGRYNVTASGHTLIPISLNDLNESMCAPLNRKGLVCRECIDGFGLSVTSFDYKCVNCTAVWYSIPLFLFLEFFPVTVSYFFILTFRISMTSPPMPCFIMFAQFFIYLTDYHHLWTGTMNDNEELTLSYKVLRTVYGLFNLDFFRYLPPPLCLGTWLKLIHIAFFRIFTSFYPLFLIFLTWVCVKLHDRNIQLIVCLWRPFHKCFVRLRKGWDSKSDLVDVFITFFILTYYKFVYITTVVSFHREKLIQVDMSGNISYISLAEIDLNFVYYSKSYTSFVVIFAMLYFVYIILPPLLLILYPIKIFRSSLSKCRLDSLTITIFTDKIQSCYRNGLDGGRDMRSFSAFYFYLRLLLHTVLVKFGIIILKENEWTSLGVTYSLSALIVALIRPYRKTYMNICDSLLLTNIAMMCFTQFESTITTFLLYTPVVGLVVLLFIFRVNVKKLSLPFILKVEKVLNHFRATLKSFLLSRSLKGLDNHRKNFPTADAQPLILAHAAEHISYGSYSNS